MTSAGKLARDDGGSRGPGEAVLRAKYLDYCSARVAEALLLLSPDEMFVLAEEAQRDVEEASLDPLTYDEVMRLATVRISQRLDLPSFGEWSARYRADPARFEGDLLGLWERDVTGGSGEG
ncbi:MAG: hypothetical protein EA352_07815 [Gemmatimonadales bacterium]|nr:MAG: hypothetical protein EA352_07815 [Gemmatimonadales bacterium]